MSLQRGLDTNEGYVTFADSLVIIYKIVIFVAGLNFIMISEIAPVLRDICHV